MVTRNALRSLYVQVLIGITLGVLLGVVAPEQGAMMKPLGDGFIKLIKMIIAPIVFATVVVGIARMGSLRDVGRIGLGALLYFEVASTVALLIGLVVVPFFTSYLVRTIAWTSILADRGWLNRRFQEVLGADFNLTGRWYSVVGGLTYIFLPFMILPLYSVMRGIDRSYLRAASNLGASDAQVFRHIFLPLSLPGVAAGG